MNWNYQREEQQSSTQFVGKRRCVIVDVEETTSKSGKNMIVVTVKPSGCEFKVKQYIVEGEYFNRNMTSFFDSFKEIPEGDFNYIGWIGAEGAADFALDDNDYLKIKYFISAERAENLPPFEGTKPERQVVTKIDGVTDDSDDDLPWEMS